jgi:peptidoglycan/LPS O-acetylase OafA/YrhL
MDKSNNNEDKQLKVALRHIGGMLCRLKDIKPWMGVLLVVVGVVLLAIGFVAHWDTANTFRMTALLLIVLGVVLYVAAQKLGSRY